MSRASHRLTRCQHVISVILTWTEIKARKKKKICDTCKDSSSNQWLCLHEYCQYIGCGQRVEDHISLHSKKTGHAIAINLHNDKIYCHECDVQLFVGQNHPTFQIRESDCPNHSSNANSKKANSVPHNQRNGNVTSEVNVHHNHQSHLVSSSDKDSSEDIPTGPSFNYAQYIAGTVGLRNFGNTCYMNAALQALSNCPQLNLILLDGPNIFPSQGRLSLSSAFQNLIRDMWDPQPAGFRSRTKVIMPSQVSSTFKALHPTFRSYVQQDTQEFLRLFIDRLHEESKEPLTKKAAEDMGVIVPLSATIQYDARSHEYYTTLNKKVKKSGAKSLSPPTSSSTSSAKSISEVLHYKSFISDVFRGTFCNTCQCLTCGFKSTMIEPFYDLSVPIVGTALESATSQKSLSYSSPLLHDNSSTSDNSQASSDDYACNYSEMKISANEKPGWWPWLLSGIKSWFASPKITLQNCLDAYFSEDLLTNENQYYCEKCKRLRDAIKRTHVEHLPEVLCVHLKRFRHDFTLSSKLTNQVVFPLFGLDLKPYLLAPKEDENAVTVYELFAVICHWGSGGSSGHYTCYALNHDQQQWYEYDDETVQPCEAATVTSLLSQAYVLFYRKNEDNSTALRHEACTIQQAYLHHAQESLFSFYVDRMWISKFNSFSEPGPVTNARLLCADHRELLPSYRKDAAEHLTPFCHQLWEFFIEKYGGGPPISLLHGCALCKQTKELKDRREEEYATVSRALKEFNLSDQSSSLYAIDYKWFCSWENFAKSSTLKPPGPIDNSSICHPVSQSTPNGDESTTQMQSNTQVVYALNETGSYAKLNGTIWRYLHGIYGGGPLLRIQRSSESSQTDDSDYDGNESESGT